MKTYVILAAAMAASFAATQAQESPAALPQSSPAAAAAPAAAPTPAGEVSRPGIDEPLPLIPQAPPSSNASTPAPSQTDASTSGGADAGKIPKPDPLKKGTAEQLRQSIHLRELQTQALEDPEVQAQRKQAELARTPAGRRAARRNYYTVLNAKILKLDPSLKETLEKTLYTTLHDLEQNKVEPSRLIEPITELPGSHSADHAKAASSPTPGSKAVAGED